MSKAWTFGESINLWTEYGPQDRTWICEEGCHFPKLMYLINFFLNELQICLALLFLVSMASATFLFRDICRSTMKSGFISTERKIEPLNLSGRRRKPQLTRQPLYFRVRCGYKKIQALSLQSCSSSTLRTPKLYKSAAVVRRGPSLVLEVACG